MKPMHYVLYGTSFVWDVTVCWPIVLFVWLFWGENLRWERNPNENRKDGYSLWCDLKKGSWPTRSWYGIFSEGRTWLRGNKPDLNTPDRVTRYGKFRTWGGTTLGHGGFYGPGIVQQDVAWSAVQEHEHVHVEQFEAAMLGSFVMSALMVVAVTVLVGHVPVVYFIGLIGWWLGYAMMGIANWGTAWLRGEDPYRGSHHEEAAYALDRHWRDRNPVPEKKEQQEHG